MVFFVLLIVSSMQVQSTEAGFISVVINDIIDDIVSKLTCSAKPPNFPLSSSIFMQDFENWGKTVQVRNLWKVVPRTSADIVSLSNWAFQNNYTIRPLGQMHNWSPLTVTEASNCTNTLLVDTTQHLTGIEVFPNGIENYTFPVVKAGSGILLEKLLTELELKGFGLTASAAIGKITIGGLFAVGGHGFATKVANSTQHLKNYGSVVNRIVKIEAVAWSKESQSYNLQTFDRSMHEMSALMTHLGLAFITSITFSVDRNYKLRCVSHTGIPNSELFANPTTSANLRTFASLSNSGRLAVISSPYVKYSWIMHCSDVETCPKESRNVQTPYNYPFIKIIPKVVGNLLAIIKKGITNVTPTLLNLEFLYLKIQLTHFKARDICGLSKNLLLYVEPETLRYAAFSYVILTKRQHIQQIVHMMKNKLDSTLQKFQEKSSFPMNGPMEIRTTGLDDPNDIGPGARKAFLSMTNPPIEYPEFDIAIWFEFLTFEGTPDSLKFLQEIESYIISTFNGTIGLSRPEWSKGWAVTQLGEWSNTSVMHDVIANRYGDQWNEFVKVCNDLDPHRIFRNEFLNQLFI